MLNNPNEWHNEEDDMSNDLLGDDYFDNLESDSEDFSDDGEYDEDGNFEDDENYSDEESYDESNYDEQENSDNNFEDEEYVEEDEEESEEEDDDEDDENSEKHSSGDDGGLKKKLIMASSILLIFLLVMGGIFGLRGMKNSKNKQNDNIAQIEKTETSEENNLIENEEDSLQTEENAPEKTQEATDNGEEISIDIDVEEDTPAKKEGETKTSVEEKSDGGLLVEVDDENAPTVKPEDTKKAFTGKPGETVTVAIGDIGRKNPFSPIGGVENKQLNQSVKTVEEDYGVNFPVIEPPQLSEEQEKIVKLLNTKVAGILFDPNRPSAIININGIDQLVRKGDVLSGFEMIGIDKNKVVIRCDNNIYRASIGQPLNAEKVVNSVEIANLKSKFYGSASHN